MTFTGGGRDDDVFLIPPGRGLVLAGMRPATRYASATAPRPSVSFPVLYFSVEQPSRYCCCNETAPCRTAVPSQLCRSYACHPEGASRLNFALAFEISTPRICHLVCGDSLVFFYIRVVDFESNGRPDRVGRFSQLSRSSPFDRRCHRRRRRRRSTRCVSILKVDEKLGWKIYLPAAPPTAA